MADTDRNPLQQRRQATQAAAGAPSRSWPPSTTAVHTAAAAGHVHETPLAALTATPTPMTPLTAPALPMAECGGAGDNHSAAVTATVAGGAGGVYEHGLQRRDDIAGWSRPYTPAPKRSSNMAAAWKCWLVFLLPLMLLPIPLIYRSQASWCGFIMVWMAFLWTTEALPLAVTSIIPVIMFPMLGLMSSTEVTKFYFDDIGFLLLSSLAIAAAVETSNLHCRISLKTLLIVGTSPYRLVFGSMLVTMFLSMWIPNTASASIMGPVALSVIDQVFTSDLPTTNPLVVEKQATSKRHEQRVRCIMMLAVMYAANIGGTGSIIGTGPNLVLKAQLDLLYPGSTELTFGTWMLYNAPVMILNTLLGGLFLCGLLYLALRRANVSSDSGESIRRALERRYHQLGPATFAELFVMAVLCSTIFFWFTMRPQFVRGWADYIPYGKLIKPTAPALLLSLLLFIIPKHPGNPSAGPILTWPAMQKRMQWGVMLLLGGGLALADLCKNTGLSKQIADRLLALRALPPAATVACLSLAASLLTEITSNTAVCSIMLPVVLNIAVALGVHPLYLAMPIAIACSFSFMLPAATPVNAIVYDLAEMSISQMALPGFFMNVVCVVVEVVAINYFGTFVFGLDVFPDWALPKNATASQATGGA